MAIIRHGPAPEDHYSLVPNSLARSSDLTLQAKGLYVYLRSHREGWEMSTERIAQALGVSRDTIAKYVQELENAGYLERGQIQTGDGKFSSAVYTLHVQPLPKKPDNGKNPSTVNTVNGNFRQHKKTNSFKKTKGEKKNTTPNEFGADFAEFWEHYPRKIGKATAQEKYTEARGEASRDDLLVSVKNFAAECERAGTEKRYIPYPGTWLNQERWRDYLNYAPRKSGREKLDQMKMWMEEMIERDT